MPVSRHLDVMLYGADKRFVAAGIKGLREALRQFGHELYPYGYNSIRITGLRYSGAMPGRTAQIGHLLKLH